MPAQPKYTVWVKDLAAATLFTEHTGPLPETQARRIAWHLNAGTGRYAAAIPAGQEPIFNQINKKRLT